MLIPTLTKIRDDRSLQEAVAQTASSQLAVLALPICIGGFLVARPLIELVFGPAYGASGTVLQILIWTIPLLLLRSVMEAVLISNQRQDRVLRETSLAASLRATPSAPAPCWPPPRLRSGGPSRCSTRGG